MNIGTARWIWCDRQSPNTYCHARKDVYIPATPIKATLYVVADSRYQAWVNGVYIGQGPTPFKRPIIYVDSFDVTHTLRGGSNIISVLANYHGVKHCMYTPGVPGILARLEVLDADGNAWEVVTDESWKVLASDAYAEDVPRRTWATAWSEYYDARAEPAGWEQPDYNDSSWAHASIVDQGSIKLFPRIVPPLEECAVNGDLLGIWTTNPGIPDAPSKTAQQHASADLLQLKGLTAHLDDEPLQDISDAEAGTFCLLPRTGGWSPLTIRPSERGFAIAIDLGVEIAGQVTLDIESPEGVVIDLCATETLRDGKPWCCRKWGQYANRYTTREGRQRWRAWNYDGVRYIYAVVRGPHPELVIHNIGAWQRQSSLPIRATFECDDSTVNRIWEITCHTMRVGTQEMHVDCPTREQTSAWADGIWAGIWTAYMTGDFSIIRHLLLTAEHTQLPDGQLPRYALSEVVPTPLLDMTLICALGPWLCLQTTGDRSLTERMVPVVDRILDWHRQKIGCSGLIELDCVRLHQQGEGTLFIDHPGLGWHNCPDDRPGIDRRGINAALNFFYIMALEAHANVLESLGQQQRAALLNDEMNEVRTAADALFFNTEKGAYVDGYFEGGQLAQVSQQTNALAILSGTCPPDRRRQVLSRILDTSDPNLCLCGTYFWTYLSQALCDHGMHREMWDAVVEYWGGMAKLGATTWWETFLGDELDSLCHTWSCLPGHVILADILGVKPAEAGFSKVDIRPRFDLISNAQGSMPVRNGEIKVQWEQVSVSQYRVSVELTAEASATVHVPDGWVITGTEDNTVELSVGVGRTTFLAQLAANAHTGEPQHSRQDGRHH